MGGIYHTKLDDLILSGDHLYIIVMKLVMLGVTWFFFPPVCAMCAFLRAFLFG